MRLFFQDAFKALMKEEGGDKFVNDPKDPGGATRWGISLRFLRRLWEQNDPDYTDLLGPARPTVETVKSVLTEDIAKAFAYRKFWKPCRIENMPGRDIPGAVFDFAYNAGPRVAIMALQTAINQAGPGPIIPVDGWVGHKTLAALQRTVDIQGDDAILAAFTDYREAYYLTIVRRNPGLERFLKGWLNRAEAEDTKDLPSEQA